jgi:demethylmenaquinone methyltransferase/2-methoxy-6-polyprenyl-1,4-benzoquinol methylase
MARHTPQSLVDYYAHRAAEHDRVYEKPERQDDLRQIAQFLPGALRNHRVLEVACGTGFWTKHYAPPAESVTAVDINSETLAIAQQRLSENANVKLQVADAYALEGLPAGYTAAFAGFWWSHVPRGRLKAFLNGLHRQLVPGGLVVFVDNLYVEGSSTAVSREDEEGNTYQLRRLEDGREFEVLKNFSDRETFLATVGRTGEQVRFDRLTYYWHATYTVCPPEPATQ